MASEINLSNPMAYAAVHSKEVDNLTFNHC